MRYTWNQAKSDANERKHGISLEQAAEVFDDPLCRYALDALHSDDEDRLFIIGHIRTGLLIAVTYVVLEDDDIRLISARRATRYETRRYMNIDELRDGDDFEDYGDIDTRNLNWNRMKVGPPFKIDRGPATVTLDDRIRLFFFGDVEVNSALRALIHEGRIGPHFQHAIIEEQPRHEVSVDLTSDDLPGDDEDYGDIDTRNLDWSRMKVGPPFKIDRGPATVTLDDHVRLFFFGDVEVNNALHALSRAGRIGPHFVDKKPAVSAPETNRGTSVTPRRGSRRTG